jgi:asparagine synthase (glutamine-hydrolysing)
VSGFAGVVRGEPAERFRETDRSTLGKMARAIAFRGPDGQQQWQRDGASFAFSLLRTGPAPQEPAQPCTLDQETWFLGEARPDGREELIRTLAGEASELAGVTSEELLLRFISRFGQGALPRLDGDFSFVLWNARTGRLAAYRDPTGTRPFFYAWRGGKLSFSNTLQALSADPDVRRGEYDPEFIANFLLGAPHHEPERTVYLDIRRLPAGHLLEFSGQDVSVRRIANFPIEELLEFDRDQEVLDEFKRLLREAVRDRLPASEASVFLSGGLDSTSIAAACVELRRRACQGGLGLQAITMDLEPLCCDEEGAYAESFAKSLGLPLLRFHVSHFLPFEGQKEISLPEPSAWPYSKLQRFSFAEAERIAPVTLTGDGGDEILNTGAAPYLRYLASRHGLLRALGIPAGYALTRGKLPYLGMGIRSGVKRLIGRADPPAPIPPWLTSEAVRTFGLRERFERMAAEPPSAHPVHPRPYALFNGQSFAESMEEQDATWTATHVESRAPLLDRRLLRFLLRLPPIPWFMGKELVRRAQKGVLPESPAQRGSAAAPRAVRLVVGRAARPGARAPGPIRRPGRAPAEPRGNADLVALHAPAAPGLGFLARGR